MLTRFDDYPLHQTPEPVAHPVSGDRNFYDRYFFNGYTRDGSLYFAAALGVYPNRNVIDASFSVVRGGVQVSLHASGRAPRERSETRVGPISVEVEGLGLTAASMSDPESPAVRAMLAANERLGLSTELTGFSMGTDGRHFSAAGIPTIIYGPGDPKLAHIPDEWVGVDEVLAAASAYALTALGMLTSR